MKTRGKLNCAYFLGAAVIAAYAGLVFNSWWVFGIIMALLVALNLHAGNIRLGMTRR